MNLLLATINRRQREERLWDWRAIRKTDPNRYGGPSNDQAGFLECEAVERWLFGGNRSSKTESAVADCIMFVTGEHPIRSKHRQPPVYVRYCAPSYEDNIKAVLLKKFQQMAKRKDLRGGDFGSAWSEQAKTLYWANGSRINFKSSEQAINKWGGDDLDAVYQDEHIPVGYYRENKMRLVDRAGYYVAAMTPEEGAISWEKRHVLNRDPKEVAHWYFSIYGNPHLSAEGIAEVEKAITDERVREVKLFGKFVALAGLVYPQFDAKIHRIKDIDLPLEWPRVFVIDPHIKKESAMIWVCWTPEKEMIVYRCAKVDLTVEQLKQFIRVQSAGEKINLWIGDEAMGGAGTNIYGQESVLTQLGKGDNALPIIPTNQGSDKAFEAGVMRVREMLTPEPITNKPSLMVTESCQGVVDEFEEYQFIPDTKADEMTFRQRVRAVFDDYMADVRYAAMAGPQGVDVQEGPQIVLQHKPRSRHTGIH